MNAIMGANLPNGWLVAVFCWFILRLLGRLDDLEKADAVLTKKVDQLQRTLEGAKTEV